MTSEPTVEELENIAKQKMQNSSDENDAAKKLADLPVKPESEDVSAIDNPDMPDANASRYNIRRKVQSEPQSQDGEKENTEKTENDEKEQ